jgi:hypothetical protein
MQCEDILIILQQFGSALKYIHSKGIVHSDLKTENMLLMSNGTVTIIDFGCAIYERDLHPPALGTQEYRSPEALLQCGWSYPTDIWSAGCILAELLIGKPLFPHGAAGEQHLACMQACLGQRVPLSLLARAASHPDPSNPICFLCYSLGTPHFAPRAPAHGPAATLTELTRRWRHAHLLQRMLAWEPAHRLTAAALHHALQALAPPPPAAGRSESPWPSSRPPRPASAEAAATSPAAGAGVCLERAGSAPPGLTSQQLAARRAAKARVAVIEGRGSPRALIGGLAGHGGQGLTCADAAVTGPVTAARANDSDGAGVTDKDGGGAPGRAADGGGDVLRAGPHVTVADAAASSAVQGGDVTAPAGASVGQGMNHQPAARAAATAAAAADTAAAVRLGRKWAGEGRGGPCSGLSEAEKQRLIRAVLAPPPPDTRLSSSA